MLNYTFELSSTLIIALYNKSLINIITKYIIKKILFKFLHL